MSLVRCPICEKSFESDESQSMPFCSARCRTIDLGRWLDEGYGLPIERDPEGEEGDQQSEIRRQSDDDN